MGKLICIFSSPGIEIKLNEIFSPGRVDPRQQGTSSCHYSDWGQMKWEVEGSRTAGHSLNIRERSLFTQLDYISKMQDADTNSAFSKGTYSTIGATNKTKGSIISCLFCLFSCLMSVFWAGMNAARSCVTTAFFAPGWRDPDQGLWGQTEQGVPSSGHQSANSVTGVRENILNDYNLSINKQQPYGIKLMQYWALKVMSVMWGTISKPGVWNRMEVSRYLLTVSMKIQSDCFGNTFATGGQIHCREIRWSRLELRKTPGVGSIRSLTSNYQMLQFMTQTLN